MNGNTLLKWAIDYLRDPLRKNTIILIASDFVNLTAGFLFWVLAARFYDESNLGFVVAMISAANLIVTFSHLGLGIGIIRFLPAERNKTGMIKSCLTVVALFSFSLAVIYIVGLNIWSPALILMQREMILAVIFILMTVFIALLSLYTNIFIAYQSAFFYFVLMAIFGLRILPLILLAALGAIGIALSYFIALSTAIIVGYFFIGKLVNDYVLKPGIQKKIISKLASFSFGNYVAEALKYLPHVILPVLIVNRLGKDMGAYFYSAWMLAYLLFGISYYTGSMLLSALSNRRYEVRHHVAKAARLLFVLLIPSTALLFWGSNLCLSVFGASYAMEASNLLRILAFSTIPMAANELYIALCRFDKKLKRVIFIYAFIALVTISGGFLLLKTIGLLGIGIAWLSSQMALVVFTIPLTVKRVKVAAVKE